ncbi:hypothetical protein EMIT0324P_11441 [Pseudomonas chlororaphis]
MDIEPSSQWKHMEMTFKEKPHVCDSFKNQPLSPAHEQGCHCADSGLPLSLRQIFAERG